MNQSSGPSRSMANSNGGNWRSEDAVSDRFPAGLRVLVVDDDPTCLVILERMLKTCLYEVTKCNRAEMALSLLRENKNGYDVVISDVHMPDMDGFKLLEHVGLEMDLPVIMMSADDSKAVVMKGVTHGACDYLIKPVRMDALKNIWQHVVRKKKHEWKELEHSKSGEETENRQCKQIEDPDYSSSANEGSWRNSRKRKDDEDDLDDRDDSSTLKKPRVVWSVELHQQFVAAVDQLGIDKAVPKKILEMMNVSGLTRENVASHLQKYRLYLRRISGGVPQHPGVLNNGYMGSQDGPFGAMSCLSGLDLQAIAASGHLPAQSLAALQSAVFDKGTTLSVMSMHGIDQRNIFSFENPKIRFGDAKQHQQMTDDKQINVLHGIPTNMESKQLTSLNHIHSESSRGSVNMQPSAHGSSSGSTMMQGPQTQSSTQLLNDGASSHLFHIPSTMSLNHIHSESSRGSVNIQPSAHGSSSGSTMMQGPQTQSSTQLLNDGASSHLFHIPSTMGLLNASTGASEAFHMRNSNLVNENRRTGLNPTAQSSAATSFPMNNPEFHGTSFSLPSAPGIMAAKGMLHDEISSRIKGSTGYGSNYDMFNDIHLPKAHAWELQSVRLQFDDSHQTNISQGANFDASHTKIQPQNFTVGTAHYAGSAPAAYSGDRIQHFSTQNTGQQIFGHNHNSVKVKGEMISDFDYGQEDLMSALLKQHPGTNGAADEEFDFDGYPPMGNIPA